MGKKNSHLTADDARKLYAEGVINYERRLAEIEKEKRDKEISEFRKSIPSLFAEVDKLIVSVTSGGGMPEKSFILLFTNSPKAKYLPLNELTDPLNERGFTTKWISAVNGYDLELRVSW